MALQAAATVQQLEAQLQWGAQQQGEQVHDQLAQSRNRHVQAEHDLQQQLGGEQSR